MFTCNHMYTLETTKAYIHIIISAEPTLPVPPIDKPSYIPLLYHSYRVIGAQFMPCASPQMGLGSSVAAVTPLFVYGTFPVGSVRQCSRYGGCEAVLKVWGV